MSLSVLTDARGSKLVEIIERSRVEKEYWYVLKNVGRDGGVSNERVALLSKMFSRLLPL
jgi:hypothetical protein